MTATEDTYRSETLSLFKRLESAGFRILSVDNGEEMTMREDVELCTFLDETMACDEASLRVLGLDGEKLSLFLVYGNGPGELVCDLTCNDRLERVVSEHYQAHS